MAWTNPRPGDISPEALRAILKSLEDYLKNPTFENGVNLGDASPPVYDPTLGITTPPPTVEVTSENVGIFTEDALQSDNYDGTDVATGDATEGWRVERDTGSAEFGDARIRGEITASEFHGASTVQALTNGTFDVDTSGWAVDTAFYPTSVIARVTTPVRTGAGALRLGVSGATTSAHCYTTIPAVAGDIVHFRCYVRKESVVASPLLSNLAVLTVQAFAGATAQTSTWTLQKIQGGAAGWTLLEGYWAVPDGTATPIDTIRFEVYTPTAGSAAQRLYIDDALAGVAPVLEVPWMTTHENAENVRTLITPGRVQFDAYSAFPYGMETWDNGDTTDLDIVGQRDSFGSAPTVRLRQNLQTGESDVRLSGDHLYLPTDNATDVVGAWRSYTPSVWNGATSVARTVTYAKYMKIGKTIMVTVRLDITGTGVLGNILLAAPVTAAAANLAVGTMFFYDLTANTGYFGTAFMATQTTFLAIRDSSVGNAAIPTALGAGDVVWLSATYEAL
jgi:hypothetical protein